MNTETKNRSDLAILTAMYDMYLPAFIEQSERPGADSQEKVYIPIDVAALADKLSMNRHVLWGRLYYHLDQKYGYVRDGAHTNLFAMQVGDKRHCIHFPLVSAIAAERESEFRRYFLPIIISLTALVFAVVSFFLKAH